MRWLTFFQQCRKVHRRNRCFGMMTEPAQSGGGAQGIKYLLSGHLVAIAEIGSALTFAEVEIVPAYKIAVCDALRQGEKLISKFRIGAIADG